MTLRLVWSKMLSVFVFAEEWQIKGKCSPPTNVSSKMTIIKESNKKAVEYSAEAKTAE